MKKLSMLMISILLVALASGCSLKAFEADEDTIYVKNKGNIIGAIVEDFDKEYYDEEELKLLLNEEVETYNGKAGEGSVKIDKFEVKDQVVKVYINYKNGKNYEEFNGVTFFSGTILVAEDEGFNFDTDFIDGNGKKISKDEILQNESYHVIITDEDITVQTDATILYHSNNTELKEKNKASISEETEDLAYIIYK